MRFSALFIALVLAGCYTGAHLPEPEGQYEPLNGWDPNAPLIQPAAANQAQIPQVHGTR